MPRWRSKDFDMTRINRRPDLSDNRYEFDAHPVAIMARPSTIDQFRNIIIKTENDTASAVRNER